jgi:hypothetical protein
MSNSANTTVNIQSTITTSTDDAAAANNSINAINTTANEMVLPLIINTPRQIELFTLMNKVLPVHWKVQTCFRDLEKEEEAQEIERAESAKKKEEKRKESAKKKEEKQLVAEKKKQEKIGKNGDNLVANVEKTQSALAPPVTSPSPLPQFFLPTPIQTTMKSQQTPSTPSNLKKPSKKMEENNNEGQQKHDEE